jgi:hypothetical protein
MNRSVNIYLNEAKKEKKEVKQSFIDKVKNKTIAVGKHFEKNWKNYALGGAAATIAGSNINNIITSRINSKDAMVKRKDYYKNAKANDDAKKKAYIDNENLWKSKYFPKKPKLTNKVKAMTTAAKELDMNKDDVIKMV